MMFTYSRPYKPRAAKPVTPAMVRQQKSESRLRRFDQAAICVYGLMALVLLVHLI
jgi:hypothetical protein